MTNYLPVSPKRRDLTGIRVGRLTVQGLVRIHDEKGNAVGFWHCLCDCGGEITARTNALIKEATSSCGCLAREIRRAPKKHGYGKSSNPTYRIWQKIRERCLNPNCAAYPRYGGRGIKLCDRWQDFTNFLADMGERPSPKHSIDRINNDGDYEPCNCRWATQREQMANVSYNRYLTANGETLHLTDWARRLGTDPSIIFYRLQRGWSVEKAVTQPVQQARCFLTAFGETLSLADWSRRTGIDVRTLWDRLQRGWPAEDILSRPIRKVALSK